MAVVQISRIQVRRGRKNSATSIPQLASGEMGWAVDTQELYIGNGSVSEGSPFVGNTKILTERDNILDLVAQYQYKKDDATIQTGDSPATPVSRSLQQRLDETVNIQSFGAVGDGITDDTDAIQRALFGLYLNDATVGSVRSRIPLYFGPGEYLISNTLLIPPHAELRGAGKDKTVFKVVSDIPVANTVGVTDEGVDLSNLTQARNVHVSGITFQSTSDNSAVVVLSSLKDSKFIDCAFRGAWQNGNPVNFFSSGLAITAENSNVTSKEVVFENCDIQGVGIVVDSTFDIENIKFDNCTFSESGYGFYLGYDIGSTGRTIGPRFIKIQNSKFIDIDKSAFYVGSGYGNISSTNIYVRCGQDGGSSNVLNKLPVIDFRSEGNISDNDFFERALDLGSTASFDFLSSQYVSEVTGATYSNHKFNNKKNIVSALDTTLIRLPGNADNAYAVHYVYKSTVSSVFRKGTMTVLADTTNNRAHIVDEYDATGSLSSVENLRFTASYNSVQKAVNVNYTTNQTGTLTYWYESMS
jgi:hypothetical protein